MKVALKAFSSLSKSNEESLIDDCVLNASIGGGGMKINFS